MASSESGTSAYEPDQKQLIRVYRCQGAKMFKKLMPIAIQAILKVNILALNCD